MRIPYIRLFVYFRNVHHRRCINIFHIHTGFNDYSLFWWADGKLMDLFFIRITINKINHETNNATGSYRAAIDEGAHPDD